MSGEPEAHGWAAVEEALRAIRPGPEPLRCGLGNDPEGAGLVGLNAYRAKGHWLMVTLGLTELFEKVSEHPEVSGWGYELTIRVPDDGGPVPPDWAVNLLADLGAYVFESGEPFGVGHRMDPGGPITGAGGTRLTALAFAPDPELEGIDSPNGRVEFLTVVGITAGELARMKAGTTREVIEALAVDSPLLLTDPRR